MERKVAALGVQPATTDKFAFVRRLAAWVGGLSLRSRLRWAGFLFVLPALIHLATFKFYPMLEAFRLSFYRYDLMSPPVFNGLRNYQVLWENPLFHQSFWVSAKYMFGVALPEWFLALGLALLLNRQMPGRSFIRLAYFFPIAMSQIVVAMVWKFMYHPHGLVNTILEFFWIGRINWLSTEETALPALIVIGIWRGIPLFAVLYLAGLQSIPKEYYEAAAIDGAGPLQRFLHITVPLLLPTILLRHRHEPALGREGVSQPAGHDGGRPERDHAGPAVLHLRDGVRLLPHGRGGRGLDGALCLRFRPDADSASSLAPRWFGMNQKTLLRYGGWLVTLLTILGIGVVLLPYFWMVSSSLKTGAEVFELPDPVDSASASMGELSQRAFPGILRHLFLQQRLRGSGCHGGERPLLQPGGLRLGQIPIPLPQLCFVLILSTLMLPLEIMLVPTYLVVRQLGLVNNYGGLIVPLLVDAFGIFLMRQYIKSLPDSLIEAARLDGCSEFGIFWRIILPNCKPALGALALLSFRDTWDQFLWPFIVASDDALKTFPLGLAQMEGIDSAAYHEIMAIAVMGMIPAALIFLFFQRAFVRGIALTGLKE